MTIQKDIYSDFEALGSQVAVKIDYTDDEGATSTMYDFVSLTGGVEYPSLPFPFLCIFIYYFIDFGYVWVWNRSLKSVFLRYSKRAPIFRIRAHSSFVFLILELPPFVIVLFFSGVFYLHFELTPTMQRHPSAKLLDENRRKLIAKLIEGTFPNNQLRSS